MADYPVWAYREDGTKFQIHNDREHLAVIIRCSHFWRTTLGSCLMCVTVPIWERGKER